MATAERIAPTVNAANSADITVVAGTEACFKLKPVAGGALAPDAIATVYAKSTGGDYTAVGQLRGTPMEARALTWWGAGVYRISKPASTTSYGVDQD